jgi:hypothetical protein
VVTLAVGPGRIGPGLGRAADHAAPGPPGRQYVIDDQGGVRVVLGVAELPVRAKSRPPVPVTSRPGLQLQPRGTTCGIAAAPMAGAGLSAPAAVSGDSESVLVA